MPNSTAAVRNIDSCAVFATIATAADQATDFAGFIAARMRPRFKKTWSTATDAGVTPGSRAASPTVCG